MDKIWCEITRDDGYRHHTLLKVSLGTEEGEQDLSKEKNAQSLLQEIRRITGMQQYCGFCYTPGFKDNMKAVATYSKRPICQDCLVNAAQSNDFVSHAIGKL